MIMIFIFILTLLTYYLNILWEEMLSVNADIDVKVKKNLPKTWWIGYEGSGMLLDVDKHYAHKAVVG